ncbi:hypothetical protein [Curtobacterium sp. MCBD17_040]|uniref:hypothetical protein n=1 Tax=Curtobacterium sp. MCBD17_040 TaxID=2175674 RepID=UPI000DA9B3AF|nr:hypothetical protein [Curtobacterium sp. MCBD17_040]WIB65604.1 hypothetical protein DEI94_19715 [Curtobacterium sp. MCBD17_040]
MSKPSFQEFQNALFYQEDRAALGIPLTTLQVRDLLDDKRALATYYRGWTPNFDPLRQSVRLPRTAREARTNVAGGFAGLVFLTLAAMLTGWAAAGAQLL